jgi:hypothetical protein
MKAGVGSERKEKMNEKEMSSLILIYIFFPKIRSLCLLMSSLIFIYIFFPKIRSLSSGLSSGTTKKRGEALGRERIRRAAVFEFSYSE